MRRTLWRHCLLLALGGSLLGCERSAVRTNYPPDPMLVSKAAIEGKTESAHPLLAHNEPVMPNVPPSALASAPKRRSSALRAMARNTTPVAPSASPTDLTPHESIAKTPSPASEPILELPASPPAPARPGATVSAVPAVRTNEGPKVEATPASSRREIVGDYGHAPDHVWLQGVLDRHYQGTMQLRYCDATQDDDWGGKVSLEPDAKLAAFHEGDVVHVEGELVRENGQVQRGRWNQYPRYRVTSIRLVRSR